MSKIERLLNLTAVLLDSKRPLSAKELRSKIEGYPQDHDNFLRMFERDKEDLRSMGIPIDVKTSFTSESASEGYIIAADEYYLPDLGLSEQELASLNLAALSVQIDGFSSNEAIWKLGGQQTEPNSNEETLGSVSFDSNVVPLFESVRSKQVIGFLYNDLDRIVSPWRLDFRKGRWYLIGYDHQRGAERNYRLDRMKTDVKVIETKITYIESAQKNTVEKKPWEYGDESSNVQLWVSSKRSDTAKRTIGDNAVITDNKDGSIICDVPVSNIEPFRAFVLDLLEHAEILSPPEARSDLIEWLKKVQKHYG